MNNKLHDRIKKDYEGGLYSRNYDYKTESNVYGQNTLKELRADYASGAQKFREDLRNGHVRHWHTFPLLRVANRLIGGRMQETIDFIRGYKDEAKKPH
ncbi:hypothetical protein [Fructobacillus durionis]|uniref:Uncharacterized protein n=1 Tax=Fructobacillus durionis TaxID=283737 RepID=A0A1I1E1H4_9LACO|nr:hypothetical protein [Fructobacillus durionis]SFB78820.1 hypothetical protein SAMN05660453_0153 [Fructobacillus durionis]